MFRTALRLRSKRWCGSADEGQSAVKESSSTHPSRQFTSFKAAPMTRIISELNLVRQPLPTIRSDPDLNHFTYIRVRESSVSSTWKACSILVISSDH
jgi:hypothetical protein